MSKDEQEYLYNSEYVTISHKVEGDDGLVVVENHHGELIVASRSGLTKKEDSWEYKKAQERKQEIEAITKKAEDNLNAIASKVVDRALRSLSSRMKFNAAFSNDLGNSAGWAIMISNELEKMIKEKAKDEMKEFQL